MVSGYESVYRAFVGRSAGPARAAESSKAPGADRSGESAVA